MNLLLSSILVCLCLLLIWHMVKGITVPLEQLCLRAKEIGRVISQKRMYPMIFMNWKISVRK